MNTDFNNKLSVTVHTFVFVYGVKPEDQDHITETKKVANGVISGTETWATLVESPLGANRFQNTRVLMLSSM